MRKRSPAGLRLETVAYSLSDPQRDFTNLAPRVLSHHGAPDFQTRFGSEDFAGPDKKIFGRLRVLAIQEASTLHRDSMKVVFAVNELAYDFLGSAVRLPSAILMAVAARYSGFWPQRSPNS
jgi:hypothetical protein